MPEAVPPEAAACMRRARKGRPVGGRRRGGKGQEEERRRREGTGREEEEERVGRVKCGGGTGRLTRRGKKRRKDREEG